MKNKNLKRCNGTNYPGDKTRTICKPHMEPLDGFNKMSKSPDGLAYKCKRCESVYNAEKKNRPKVDPPEFMACRNCGETKHHSEMRNDSGSRDGKGNICSDCTNKENSQRSKNNPEKARARVQRRRQREAEVHLQDVFITELLERYNSQCVYCETSVDIETGVHEHVVPVVNGGLGANFNAVLVCKPCNSSKGGRAYHTWFDTHHDKRKIVLYPDLYLWSAQWEARSLQLQKYREAVKSPEFIETIKANPELLEHEYLKTGLAAKSLQDSI